MAKNYSPEIATEVEEFFKKEELKEQKILETEKWEKQIKIFDLNQAGSLAEWIYQLWEEIQKR